MNPPAAQPGNYLALPLADWDDHAWREFFLGLHRQFTRNPAPLWTKSDFPGCSARELRYGPLRLRKEELSLRVDVRAFGCEPARFLRRWNRQLPEEIRFTLGPIECGSRGLFFTLVLTDDYRIADANGLLDRKAMIAALRELMQRVDALCELTKQIDELPRDERTPDHLLRLHPGSGLPDLARLVAWLLGFANPLQARTHPRLHQTAVTMLEWFYRSPASSEVLPASLRYSCCHARLDPMLGNDHAGTIVAPLDFQAPEDRTSRHPARLYLVQSRPLNGATCFALRLRDVRTLVHHHAPFREALREMRRPQRPSTNHRSIHDFTPCL